MKKPLPYHDDPFMDPQPEPSIPVLGKDWPPPDETTHLDDSTQPTKNTKPDHDDLHFQRHRPELAQEGKKSQGGDERQMQSDLRYTSVMKKDKEIKDHEAQKKVSEIASRSDNVLMKIKAVFPFDLFPNTVIIDANKVTVIDSIFFASETVTSILLEEITDVVVESNFFLAKLNITYSHHPLKPEYYAVPALKKREALRAKEIIQGLLVLRISEGIDLSKLQPDDIVKELTRIGKSHENLPAI